MVFELQRADRVRDLLQRIRLPVREIVHRVNAPLVAGAMMRRVQDAVHHRIAHVQVGRCHVDLGAQRARAVGKFALAHALEQVEILFHRAIAIRAFLARLGQRATILANFFGTEIVDVRLAGLDQLHRPRVQLVEIIGGVEHAIAPVGAQPACVGDDRVDVLLLFLLGIGVVKAQVGLPAELFCQPEIQADRLRVTDMQVAVGLGRKAGLHASVVLVGLQVVEDNVANEVGGAGCGFARSRRGRSLLRAGISRHDCVASVCGPERVSNSSRKLYFTRMCGCDVRDGRYVRSVAMCCLASAYDFSGCGNSGQGALYQGATSVVPPLCVNKEDFSRCEARAGAEAHPPSALFRHD